MVVGAAGIGVDLGERARLERRHLQEITQVPQEHIPVALEVFEKQNLDLILGKVTTKEVDAPVVGAVPQDCGDLPQR